MIGANSPRNLELKPSGHRKKQTKDLSLNHLSLLAIDPGGTTGWSLIIIPIEIAGYDKWWQAPLKTILERRLYWNHGQIDCDPISPGAREMCKLFDAHPSAAVISESFFVRQMAADLSPVRLMAIMEHHLWHHMRELHQQQASMGKRVNDFQLKELEAYTSEGGLNHARDADRHAIMTIRRCMDKGGSILRPKLWPHIYGSKA